jgi:hypothetical protein
VRDIGDEAFRALEAAFQLGNHAIKREGQSSDLVIRWRRIDAHRERALCNLATCALYFDKQVQGDASASFQQIPAPFSAR